MLDNIKAVIFDMDGTLIDSMWMWGAIDEEYLGRYGIEVPESLREEIEGKSFDETAWYFQEIFPQIPQSVEEMKQTWNDMAIDKYRNEVPLREGVIDFLSYLKQEGIKTGIATSNSPELLQIIMEGHDLNRYFDIVQTADKVGKGKPAPDIYLYVAEKLGVPPRECLVFEDVLQGAMAGVNAGMKVCGVYDKYSASEEENMRALTDYYIYSFKELCR